MNLSILMRKSCPLGLLQAMEAEIRLRIEGRVFAQTVGRPELFFGDLEGRLSPLDYLADESGVLLPWFGPTDLVVSFILMHRSWRELWE